MASRNTAVLPRTLVIATRESALAMWQARFVEGRIAELYPDLEIRVLGMTTEGDRNLGTSLATIGGKGLFVKELEEALARGHADIAVHSMKDVPVELRAGHVIAAIPERADPRDAFVSNRYSDFAALPAGACVGTSSLRRESQLRAARANLRVEPLRGNVQTRLRKLDEDQYDAILLAAAGLKRLELETRIRSFLAPEQSLPAAGQGALGVECRGDRDDIVALLAPLNHTPTALAVRAERAVSRTLAGSCNVPLAAYAEISGENMRLRGYVGSPDGSRVVRGTREGAASDAEAIGVALAEELRASGAAAILADLEAAGRSI
jgi:hydroxymethylbilane synthase